MFMTVDRRGRGTLPEPVRRELGIETEDSSLVLLEKTERGTYEIVPATLIPKDQIWFHHPEMQARVDEVEADFREGRFTRTDTNFQSLLCIEGERSAGARIDDRLRASASRFLSRRQTVACKRESARRLLRNDRLRRDGTTNSEIRYETPAEALAYLDRLKG